MSQRFVFLHTHRIDVVRIGKTTVFRFDHCNQVNENIRIPGEGGGGTVFGWGFFPFPELFRYYKATSAE